MKWLFLSLILFLLGCSDSVVISCKSDSLEDIGWLQQEIESAGYNDPNLAFDVYVYRAQYQLRTVFIVSICCPFCMVVAPDVKDCQGNKIGTLGVDIDNAIIDSAKIIWRTHNNVCDG